MITWLKALAKRHWPRLHLRTILLSTFILVAALPGFGALFLRVYENVLVRQTESELVAEGAALAAATAADWPGYVAPQRQSSSADYPTERRRVDLRASSILPERPPPRLPVGSVDPQARRAAALIAPVLKQTTDATLASILLLDRNGRLIGGPLAGRRYAALPEVNDALAGRATTVLRRNAAYRRTVPIEWLSRAADLRLHHARPIEVNGRTVGVILLSRSPPALYMGLYEDAGKIAFGAIAILAIIVVLSGLLSRGIVRPIERLGAATRDVARGTDAAIPDIPETAAIEIQALYADFAAMAAAIERRSRYLRDFAHAVSHEFKTPLAGICGAVELLQDHHATMSEADRQRFLANAATDAQRLTLLVTRLLELARADMMPPGEDRSDAAIVLRRLADGYSTSAFAVRLEVPDTLPPIAMQDATLETAIASLLDNCRQAGARNCTIAAFILPEQLRLSIMDDGPGIPPADRERLFEPFFTTRRSTGGTGLGLPIARSLLDACRGTIALNDTNSGTQFVIELPLA